MGEANLDGSGGGAESTSQFLDAEAFPEEALDVTLRHEQAASEVVRLLLGGYRAGLVVVAGMHPLAVGMADDVEQLVGQAEPLADTGLGGVEGDQPAAVEPMSETGDRQAVLAADADARQVSDGGNW